ncbi:hypothetical protein BC827DRAFT_1144922 [Russula dissimulans]|nr:hypothetical protein BC827DRAFT_1144922 [Russula dissimulans]
MSLYTPDSPNHPPTPSQPADLVPHSPFLSHISHESRIDSGSDADDDTRPIRRLQSRADASQPPEGSSASTSPQKTDDNAATATALPLSLSLTLKNTGSVARDHLSSERTFLAYVRTSLSFASAGVALVQLFRVSVNVSTNDLPNSEFAVAPYARPLGATLIAFGMAVLALGTVRYFTIQRALPQGLFPAARLSIFLQAVSLATVVGIVFGILVAVH